MKFSLTKQVAYFLKISIQIRQKICSLAAKAAARTKTMAEAKVEAKVFKDLYHQCRIFVFGEFYFWTNVKIRENRNTELD